PVGILSDRDILKALARPPRNGAGAQANGKAPHGGLLAAEESDPLLREKVSSVMSRQFVTVTPESLLMDAISTFLTTRTGCLPVVAPDKHLCGIITVTDVLHAIRMVMKLGPLCVAPAEG